MHLHRYASHGRGAVVSAVAITGIATSLTQAAHATGPSFMTVSTSPPAALSLLNSVVQVTKPAVGPNVAGRLTGGTGSIIDKFTFQGTGYLCVLTSDHIFASGYDRISFKNSPTPGKTNAPDVVNDYHIVSKKQIKATRIISGVPTLQKVDADVVLVKYGTIDTFFNGLTTFTIGTASPTIGSNFSEVGYGDRGSRGPGANTMVMTTKTYGLKRAQNNKFTASAANLVVGPYNYKSLVYQFNKPGVGAVGGEGYAGKGDAGAPFLNTALKSRNTGATQPALSNNAIYTNTIVGIDSFGPYDGVANGDYVVPNGAIHTGVNIVEYRPEILLQCSALRLQVVPEPGAVAFAVIFGAGVAGLALQRRARRKTA